MRLCTLNSHSNNRALNPSETLTVIRQQRKPVARIGGRGMKPVGSADATHACKMGSNGILSSRTLIKFINLLCLQSHPTLVDFIHLHVSETKSKADYFKNQIYAAHFWCLMTSMNLSIQDIQNLGFHISQSMVW